jgi:transmembrane 9 superfamily protein 2/4
MRAYLYLVAVLCVSLPAFGFYLPGVAPVDLLKGSPVELKVVKLTSVHTQLPYQYYSLNFCPPEDGIKASSENLGEILRGDRIENSPYNILALKNEDCKVLCVRNNSYSDLQLFSERIKEEYRVHWIVDNLPSAKKVDYGNADGKGNIFRYENGFPLGIIGEEGEKDKYFLNNHVNIKLLYHEQPDTDPSNPTNHYIRIVGFEVDPRSIQHAQFSWSGPKDNSVPSTCTKIDDDSVAHQPVTPLKDTIVPITYTYSVTWEKSDIEWASRWDIYLQMTDPQIHWFSIINSLMIVLFLTGMVAMIMMRTLHADFRRYNQLDNSDEAEETGWKLVHGDVFRPPNRPMLLSVLVGSGVQVFGMALVTMVFAVLGFLSPANRGGLMTAVVVLFVLMAIFAGYFSTRCYKMFKGQSWKRNSITTAFLFPGVMFSIFFFLNLFIRGQKSSGAVPVTWLLAMMAMWFGISAPLSLLGSYFAYKKPVADNPVRTNQIPRQIPEQVWYMHPVFSILMGGILPFGAVFIELFFILSSIWLHQFYYIFGFLFIVFVILILTCAEITIVMCYFQLCSEDYHWWWRSYLTAGASAFYMLLYAVFYYFTKLEIDLWVSSLLYFGYTTIMAVGFFVLTGTIGFYACMWFVRKIYGAIKVE